MGKFIVFSKSDDYGACRTEFIETTLKNAKRYYHYKVVSDEDVEIIGKYFSLVSAEEEADRSDEDRYYGTD